jgi:hypothetical protein
VDRHRGQRRCLLAAQKTFTSVTPVTANGTPELALAGSLSPGPFLRVTVDGGKLKQGDARRPGTTTGTPVSLDLGSLTLSPERGRPNSRPCTAAVTRSPLLWLDVHWRASRLLRQHRSARHRSQSLARPRAAPSNFQIFL